MSFLDRLERHFGRFAIPGLPLILVVGQLLAKFALARQVVDYGWFILTPADAIHGHPWLFLTFLFGPPPGGLITTLFAWAFFYYLGTALEGFWGAFRLNIYILVGWLFAVGAGFIYPWMPVSNAFLMISVVIAFAYLNPNFEFLILLLIPVRAKWFGVLAWLFLTYVFVVGSNPIRLQVGGCVGGFFLFFARDLYQSAGLKRRALKQSAARRAASATQDSARHRCRVCGKTDRTNPELDFRYCSQCAGDQCYCPEHIFNHAHVTGGDEASKGA